VTWAPVFALVAALGFAVSGVCLKRGLQYATALTAAVISVVFTTGFVWALAALTAPLGQVLAPSIVPFLVAGLAAPGLARLALFQGVDRIGVARSSAVASSTPLFAVTLAILFLAERPSPMLLVGVAGIVVGGALLSSRRRGEGGWRRRDLVWPLLAALGFGVRDTISRHGFSVPTHPLVAAAAATLTSLAVMGCFALAQRRRLRLAPAGLGFLAVAGLAEGIAYLTMWQALSVASVSLVSPLVNSHSVFTVGLAAVFLRDLETVGWRIVVAVALIVAGAAAVVRFN
jgi:drug/metabolite transporter (DMT)-like permease